MCGSGRQWCECCVRWSKTADLSCDFERERRPLRAQLDGGLSNCLEHVYSWASFLFKYGELFFFCRCMLFLQIVKLWFKETVPTLFLFCSAVHFIHLDCFRGHFPSFGVILSSTSLLLCQQDAFFCVAIMLDGCWQWKENRSYMKVIETCFVDSFE